MQGSIDTSNFQHRLKRLELFYHIEKYETGWINRSDWTNVHMGSNTGLNVDSNVTHNLDGNLSELIIRVLTSTDGTDVNSFETGIVSAIGHGGFQDGYTIYHINVNNIKIQTGIHGLLYISDSGNPFRINAQNWYYKIIVCKVTK